MLFNNAAAIITKCVENFYYILSQILHNAVLKGVYYLLKPDAITLLHKVVLVHNAALHGWHMEGSAGVQRS